MSSKWVKDSDPLIAAEELNAQAATLHDTVATFEIETPCVGRGRPTRSAPKVTRATRQFSGA